MYVVIVGGGRTGAQLARTLIAQDHDVHVVDDRKQVLTRIHRELPTELIHEGELLNAQVLEQAGIEQADVMAACTTHDEVNLVLCYLARKRYGVRRTIARVNNPRNAWLFNDLFHVDVELNQASIMASMIQEEMSLGDMVTLLKLRRGHYSLVEEKIPAGAKAVGVAIKDLVLPRNCVITAILRSGDVVVPRGETVFEVGDEVLALTDPKSARELVALFEDPEMD
ncbi:MAG: NAD-binding protein [Anaerolinea sp.]|nr:NAD-binding protein [Anaerolinea sp.]